MSTKAQSNKKKQNNIAEKGKKTRFKTGAKQVEIARKAGIASGEAKREKKLWKEAIAEKLGAKDFDEIIDNLIERSKTSCKDFEVLRDTMGQKPITEIDANLDTDLVIKVGIKDD